MTRRLLTLTAVVLLLGGCLPAAPGRDALSLWRHRDQFVLLEAHAGPASGHPAALEAAQLRRALAALRVRPEGRAAETLFAANELETLSDAAARGLAAATPQQDVTFAVLGMHRGAFALERRVTSGRLFVRDGALHLLFGALHAPYDEGEDRRLHPFATGNRTEPATDLREIVATDGVQFADGREDWLILDLATLGRQPETVAEQVSPAAGPVEDVAALRAEVEALRVRLETPPAPAALDAPSPRPPAENGVAERLRLLLHLQSEGLITDAEYARKKQQILDAI